MKVSILQFCANTAPTELVPTAYHLKKKGDLKRYNRTMIAKILHNMVEHQQSWDLKLHSYLHMLQLRGVMSI